MSERELLARCRDAARLEVRGARYSSEDRADIAAQLVADGLALTNGLCPARDDSRHTLTMYCGRARNLRRTLDRDRARDTADAENRADEDSLDIGALVLDLDLAERQSDADASKLAAIACNRLGYMANGNVTSVGVWSLIYRAVREAEPAVIALEAECSLATLDRRCSEGRRQLAARYPDPVALCIALLDQADPAPDMSRPAVTHGKTWSGRLLRNLAGEWREGTDGGNRPIRPVDKQDADSLCKLRKRKGRRTPKTTDAQATADALRNLGRALVRE